MYSIPSSDSYELSIPYVHKSTRISNDTEALKRISNNTLYVRPVSISLSII